jgi:hypothetical protein
MKIIEIALPDDQTDQGKQSVLFGKSARQAAASREQQGRGKLRSAKPQKGDAGPLFARPEPAQKGLFEMRIVSPRDPMIFADVTQGDDGVIHIWFQKRSQGPASPGGTIQHGTITDQPFHAVLDHVHHLLAVTDFSSIK